MTPLFKKLNVASQSKLVILNAPDSFTSETAQLTDYRIETSLAKVKTFQFALVFATSQAEVDHYSAALHDKADGDALLWFAYPKGSSKKYRCDFNRDTGWNLLRSYGYDSVRMIAIDADWSALRFRKNEFIGK
jgi:hypothetical protein